MCSDSSRSDDEYERQLFGFSRSSFAACLFSAVEETIVSKVAGARARLSSRLGIAPDDPALSRLGRLEGALKESARANLEALRPLADAALRIPAEATLPGDEDNGRPPTGDLAAARARALSSAAAARLLRRELRRLRDPQLLKALEATERALDAVEALPTENQLEEYVFNKTDLNQLQI